MHFSTLAASVCLCVASTYAAANLEGELFELTDIAVDRLFSGNFSISFTVHDPDPLTNATQECAGSWAYGSKGYPQGSYSLCGNSTFGWNMAEFAGYQKFTLGIQHKFNDPSIGEPPNDSVITYGKAAVNRTNLDCESIDDVVSCKQSRPLIEAPIYAVSS